MRDVKKVTAAFFDLVLGANGGVVLLPELMTSVPARYSTTLLSLLLPSCCSRLHNSVQQYYRTGYNKKIILLSRGVPAGLPSHLIVIVRFIGVIVSDRPVRGQLRVIPAVRGA